MLRQQLIKSASQLLPAYGKALEAMKNLYVEKPIEVRLLPKPVNVLSLFSLSAIRPNQNLCLASTSNCFTDMQYLGASHQQAELFDEVLGQIIAQLFPLSKRVQMYSVYKIMLQIIAQARDPRMPLHEYAKFLTSVKLENSPYYLSEEQLRKIDHSPLVGSIVDTLKTLTAVQAALIKKFPGMADVNILDLFINVRSRSFILENMILCPLFDTISQEAEPNCEIDGVHLTHQQQSFLILKSIKDIKEGDELTVSHNSISNLEMYFRYGKMLKNNPDSVALIKARYDDFLFYLEEAYDMKEEFFKNLGGLKDFLRVYRDRVDQKSMQLLRIFFLTNQDILNNKEIVTFSIADFEKKVSDENQTRVLKFILRNLKYYDQTASLSHDQNVKRLIEEEKDIISQITKNIEKKLGNGSDNQANSSTKSTSSAKKN